MGRNTTVLGFSVPPGLAREYEQLARRARTTKSDLFRRMVEAYCEKLAEDEFVRLQRRMAQRGRARGVFSEKDVEKLVFEDR